MKKSHIATLIVFLAVIPLTLALGSRLSGRTYYVSSTLVIAELLIPFFLAFEGRRPQARELAVLAVLCALAVAGRVAIPIPGFKAIFAIIMIAGIAFGPEAGFLVGAISALASNFFYSQGPYTPWQMMAYGAGGMLAGFLFDKNRLPRKPAVMGVFGFLAVAFFVGPLLDTCSVFLVLSKISLKGALAFYISGFSVNVTQAIATGIVLLLLGRPLLEKLERIQTKYGILEAEEGSGQI
ncbi:MAG: ECF transporter S component [Firmicutes bacterium]|nr:ECF transporter S component [Bacillota bacterium]